MKVSVLKRKNMFHVFNYLCSKEAGRESGKFIFDNVNRENRQETGETSLSHNFLLSFLKL